MKNSAKTIHRTIILLFTIIATMGLVFTPTSIEVTSENVQMDETRNVPISAYVAEGSYDFGIIAPNSSSSWMTNSTHSIYWGTNDSVELYLYLNDTFDSSVGSGIVNGAFNWTIPSGLVPATNYQIRINSTADSANYDFSDYFEIFSLKVTTPNSSSSWLTNATHFISWESDETITNVDIELYRNEVFESIALNIPNTGSYNWNVPSGLVSAADYQIRINSTADSSITDLSDTFTISSFEVTAPDGSSWMTGTSHDINWETDENIPKVDIELYLGGVYEPITLNISNTGTYNWSVPTGLASSTNYQIRISNNATNATLYDISNVFEIYSFNITTPDNSATWKTTTSHYINWTFDSNITEVDIILWRDGVVQIIELNTLNDGSYLWEVPVVLTSATNYKIRISNASDVSIRDYSENFEIYTNYITVTYPNIQFLMKAGTMNPISWESIGYVSTVDIDLYRDDVLEFSIASDVPDGVPYNWTVPTEFNATSRYQVKITDHSDLSAFDYSENFTISLLNFIIDTPPLGISSWNTEEMYSITWATTYGIENVKIELYNNGDFVSIIYADTPNDRQYRWGLPPNLNSSQNYQIRIVDTTNESQYGMSDFFEIVKVEHDEDPLIPGYTPVFFFLMTMGTISLLAWLNRRKNL